MEELKVRDAMTHLVVTTRTDDKILDAAKRLFSNRISGAPVVEGGRVVGIVSEVDLVSAYAPEARRVLHSPPHHPLKFLLRGSPPRDVSGATIRDVMTSNVVSIRPEASIFEAAERIDSHGVRRLPVIDDQGYLVGIVARSDLVRCMARAFESSMGASVDGSGDVGVQSLSA